MLSSFIILNQGGLCLFHYPENITASTSIINQLTTDYILEQKDSDGKVIIESTCVQWARNNEYGLIFVAAHPQIARVIYLDELLSQSQKKFISLFKHIVSQSTVDQFEHVVDIQTQFSPLFQQIFKKCEKRADIRKDLQKKGLLQRDQQRGNTSSPNQTQTQQSNSESEDPQVDSMVSSLFAKSKLQVNKKKLNSMKKRQNKSTSESPNTPSKRRVWDDFSYNKKKEQNLNFGPDNPNAQDEEFLRFKNEFLPDENAKTNLDFSDDEIEIQPDRKRGLVGSLWSSLVGGTLTRPDIEKSMTNFKDLLMSKNVASEIAEKICDSVTSSLVGKSFGSFQSTHATIREAMKEALTRILTPKREIDILSGIQSAKAQRRPYVITMVGVNGVGKSTSLAKIVFWLKSRGLSVMIAACDTFRSGAVEQLRVHAKCLKVPLFQRGYGVEPANIAKQAIENAKENEIDVVIVDTAGRMQANKTLMKELTNLLITNKPDLTLFVGEALVGNDGVDQLMTFNSKLTSGLRSIGAEKTQAIDGIVLTKYDTIDDKVGSSISMCYMTGHPILFVGVGQTYTDLKKLSVEKVVSQLLK